MNLQVVSERHHAKIVDHSPPSPYWAVLFFCMGGLALQIIFLVIR